jgi:hypothetical protein
MIDEETTTTLKNSFNNLKATGLTGRISSTAAITRFNFTKRASLPHKHDTRGLDEGMNALYLTKKEKCNKFEQYLKQSHQTNCFNQLYRSQFHSLEAKYLAQHQIYRNSGKKIHYKPMAQIVRCYLRRNGGAHLQKNAINFI